LLLGWLLTGLGLNARAVWAAPPVVGEVLFAKGVATAHQPGMAPRVLGPGEPLHEGDVLTTSTRSYLIVTMEDQGEMTLRPDTVFIIERYQYDPGAAPAADSAILRLLQGGLRALTGLVSKGNPQDGMRFETPVATLGIRGTDFDARLCTGDCAAEAADLVPIPERAPRVIGRVAFATGAVIVHGVDGRRRQALAGGPLYQGDDIETAADGYAVLALTDESRITLRHRSRLRVEAYAFAPAPATTWQTTFRLLRGSLRALTGIIAKRRPEAVRFETPVAVVGIRGTGFDLLCEGVCADGGAGLARAASHHVPVQPAPETGLFAYTWQGVIWVEHDGAVVHIPADRAVFVPPAGQVVRLSQLPAFLAQNPDPRPDRVSVDREALFATRPTDEAQAGLFVTVRRGEVLLQTAAAAVSIGGGESGLAELGGGAPYRLARTPTFMQQDTVPRPYQYDPQVHKVLDLIKRNLKPGAADEELECEVTE
jgi:hypothetical protein